MELRVLRVRLAAFATVTTFAVVTAVAGAAPVSLTVVHSAQNVALGKILVSASGRTPEILATHPLPDTRLRDIEARIREMFPNGVDPKLTQGRALPH